MRLIMLGTGPFAVPTLRALKESEHAVRLVITRPPQGRNATASPVEQAATELGLETWSPPTVNSWEAQERLRSLGGELLVVCDYGEILRPDTLATTRLGGINLHGSLLPKFRGAAPVQWAILRGESETGNSVIHMTPGLDAGPLLTQQRVSIDPDEDSAQLEHRLADLGATAVLDVIAQLVAGNATPIVQDSAQASKAPRLKKEQGVIDWSRTALEIKNQVRGLRPWPRAFTFWHSSAGTPVRLSVDRVAILPALPSDKTTVISGAAPGIVLDATSRLIIAASDAAIEILELQPAGKRAMSAAEFLRGNRVTAGECFGP
jgi:methionyl-tRNA formyltransferase